MVVSFTMDREVESLGLGIEVLDTVDDAAQNEASKEENEETAADLSLPSLLSSTRYGFNNKVCTCANKFCSIESAIVTRSFAAAVRWHDQPATRRNCGSNQAA